MKKTWMDKLLKRLADHSLLVNFVVAALLLVITGLLATNLLVPNQYQLDILVGTFAALGIEIWLMQVSITKKMEYGSYKQDALKLIHDEDVDIRNLIHNASKNVYIFGYTLTSLTHMKVALISAINRGVKVYLLFGVTEKNASMFHEIRGGNGSASSIKTHIRSAKTVLREISMSIEKGRAFEARRAPYILANSIIAIDVDSVSGFMQIDILLWGISSQKRPHLVIDKSGSLKYFKEYEDYLYNLWGNSEPYSIERNMENNDAKKEGTIIDNTINPRL